VIRDASANEAKASWLRATPRADSSEFSSSRWVASSRAARAAAATASKISCNEPMSSSDLATTRLLPRAVKVCGKMVAACRVPRSCRVCRLVTTAPRRWPSAAVTPGAICLVFTVSSQDASPAVSPPGPRADGATSMGP